MSNVSNLLQGRRILVTGAARGLGFEFAKSLAEAGASVAMADILADTLDGAVKSLRDRGLPVILISHNMPHVFEIADRIHIQRLGRRAAVVNPKAISMSDTVAVMTGAKNPGDLPAEALA